MSRRKCLTPGASYHYERDGGFLRFAVWLPGGRSEGLAKAKVEQLEQAFHDAIEPLLAELWVEKEAPVVAPRCPACHFVIEGPCRSVGCPIRPFGVSPAPQGASPAADGTKGTP